MGLDPTSAAVMVATSSLCSVLLERRGLWSWGLCPWTNWVLRWFVGKAAGGGEGWSHSHCRLCPGGDRLKQRSHTPPAINQRCIVEQMCGHTSMHQLCLPTNGNSLTLLCGAGLLSPQTCSPCCRLYWQWHTSQRKVLRTLGVAMVGRTARHSLH